MSIIDWFSKQFNHDSKHYVLTRVPTDTVVSTKFVANKHYFRLWLAEMYLKNDGSLFRSYSPVVQSAVEIKVGSKDSETFPYIAGPLNLNLDKNTLGRGVKIDFQLTNLIPYRGGNLSICAGLFAYVEKDYFQEFLGVLNNISKYLTLGQLSSVLNVTNTVVSGFQSLLNLDDKHLHLVYQQGFGGTGPDGGSELENGYFAVINADASQFDKSKLFVKNSQLHFGNDLESCRPLEGYDYMLFRIECASTKSDYLEVAGLRELYNKAVEKGMSDKAEGYGIIKSAIILALNSLDLTQNDAIRVGLALKKSYEEALSLNEFNNKVLSINPDQLYSIVTPILEGQKHSEDTILKIIEDKDLITKLNMNS
jgi:hypothetical protein